MDPAGGEMPDDARRHWGARGGAAIQRLTSADLERAVPERGVAMIEFTVPWCTAGQSYRDAFTQLSARHPEVVFGRIDVEQELLVARRFRIDAVPTLTVIQHRALVFRYVGALSFAALEDLLSQVRRLPESRERGAGPTAPPGAAGE